MSIEAVEQLMADTQDAIEYEHEVSKMLSANLSPASEEEVLKEFAALEAALVEPGVAATAPAAAAAAGATAAAVAPEQEQEQEAAATTEAGETPPLELPVVPTHALPTVVPAVVKEAPEKVAVMTG